MSSGNRLVYSTEQGQLGKVMDTGMDKSGSKHSKGKRRKPGKGSSQNPSSIVNPSKQGIRIRRESKGRGGKCVSIIDGLLLDEKGMKTLLKKLKAQLGTGGALKGQTLEIQGDHRDRLILLLEKEGYKAKLAGG